MDKFEEERRAGTVLAKALFDEYDCLSMIEVCLTNNDKDGTVYCPYVRQTMSNPIAI